MAGHEPVRGLLSGLPCRGPQRAGDRSGPLLRGPGPFELSGQGLPLPAEPFVRTRTSPFRSSSPAGPANPVPVAGRSLSRPRFVRLVDGSWKATPWLRVPGPAVGNCLETAGGPHRFSGVSRHRTRRAGGVPRTRASNSRRHDSIVWAAFDTALAPAPRPEEINVTDTDKLTTAAGAPVADNQNAVTAGPRGPVLMQDVWLQEKLAHFSTAR